jgi:hypothetical protein
MRRTVTSLIRRHVDQYINTVCRGSNLPTVRLVQETVNLLVLKIFTCCGVTELWSHVFGTHASYTKNSDFRSGPTDWLSSEMFVCSYAHCAKHDVNTSSHLSQETSFVICIYVNFTLRRTIENTFYCSNWCTL